MAGRNAALAYLGLWIAGLGTWAGIFWTLRRRSGPVTFVERQIAHVWAGSMVSIAGLFAVEMILGLPVLTLSPVLGVVSSMVFLVKAGMLSGQFYVQAAGIVVHRDCHGADAARRHSGRHHPVRRRLGRLLFLSRFEILPATNRRQRLR